MDPGTESYSSFSIPDDRQSPETKQSLHIV